MSGNIFPCTVIAIVLFPSVLLRAANADRSADEQELTKIENDWGKSYIERDPSLAESFHVFRVIGKIAREALDRAGEITSEVVARRDSVARRVAESFFQTLAYQGGLGHASGLRLPLEFRQQFVWQLQ